MTLSCIVDNDFAKVNWFNDGDALLSSILPLACLDFYDTDCKDPLGFAG